MSDPKKPANPLVAFWRRLFGPRGAPAVDPHAPRPPRGRSARPVHPVKPKHLRLDLREPRLEKSAEPAWRRERRYTGHAARALFSDTTRGRARSSFGLTCDEAQLTRYGLPIWRAEVDAADALGLSIGELRWLGSSRRVESIEHYVTFAIPKRSGGERLIMAPKRRLKAAQRALHQQLVQRLPVSEYAHGFLAGRSVATNAAPHVGRAVLVGMDLKDFFPSVTLRRVRGLLVALGYGHVVASRLAALACAAPRQPVRLPDGGLSYVACAEPACPQGAPTSPGLANAVCLRMDRRLAGHARSLGFTYTRYADDMAFSAGGASAGGAPALEASAGDQAAVGRLLGGARAIVAAEGFAVNEAKTRIARRGRPQRICGVTVNDTMGLSRPQRRLLRAMIHRERLARAAGRPDPERAARIDGLLAWCQMLNREQADRLRADWESPID